MENKEKSELLIAFTTLSQGIKELINTIQVSQSQQHRDLLLIRESQHHYFDKSLAIFQDAMSSILDHIDRNRYETLSQYERLNDILLRYTEQQQSGLMAIRSSLQDILDKMGEEVSTETNQ